MDKIINEIQNDTDFKNKVKELYIQHQIQKKKEEKKMTKCLWDLLPPDVEHKIMRMKKKQDNMLEIGDIVYVRANSYCFEESKFFKITGETKTQYRVSQIKHTHKTQLEDDTRSCHHTIFIPRNPYKQELIKHKNISKKNGRLQIVKNYEKDWVNYDIYGKHQGNNLNWIICTQDYYGAR